MKKRVLYDSQIFDIQGIGGISRQFVSLMENLGRYEPVLGLEHTTNLYLRQYLDRMGYDQNPCTDNALCSFYLESTQKYDIFHPTYFNTMFFNIVRKPVVCTIHDMILERGCSTVDDMNAMLGSPEFSEDTKTQIRGKLDMVRFADAIIAVSEHTKKDIVRLMNCDPDKIHVCYPGSDEKFLTMTKDVEALKKQLNFDYILYVGGRKGTKNYDMFIREYIKIHERYPDLKLLCTGFGFDKEEVDFINSNGLLGSVMHVTYVTDEEMFTLYHNARCFVFPSLYEGFGMPITEAMMCGCPVLLNNTTCFPEIGGDAAMYFNLTEEKNDFMEVFERFMTMDREEIDGYIQRGKERSRMFTIQEFTRKVEDVYDLVLEKRAIKENIVNEEIKIQNYVNT